jgi:predicted DNA-binding transcriptional regulator YafY
VRADYTTSAGETARRELSPLGLVAHGARWYVPAYDHGRAELRAFRADRFGAVRDAGRGAPAPAGFDAVAFVNRTLARVPHAHDVEVILHTREAPFPPALAELEPHPDGTRMRLRADSLDWVAGLLASAGCDFTVVAPESLRAAVHRLGERLMAT